MRYNIFDYKMSSNSRSKVSNKNSNYKAKAMEMYNGSNKIVVALVGFIVLLIIGLLIYLIYKAITKAKNGDTENPILVSGSIDAADSANSKSWILPTSSGTNSPNMAFTISFWIYITDWSYRVNDPKAIIIKGDFYGNNSDNTQVAPGIWLAPDKNNLIVATSIIGQNSPQICDVSNIPIQKWVHVAYVLENRTVDVYVNCKLERSCVLTGVPKLNNKQLHLFPENNKVGNTDKQTGFMGQLSSLRYFSSALKPIDVASICNSGPNATVGQQTTDNKPKPTSNNSCPKQVFNDLEDIQARLVDATKAVNDALDQQSLSTNNSNNSNIYDISVETKNAPIISKRNDEQYMNYTY
jgi:hypothetical protein